jgi:endonuclease/exonuclease/phosphatase family metal-dependent hydrolase
MSINVRQPDRDDGPNNWEYRKGLLLETILHFRPDVIGTQELFPLQAEFLTAGAPQYAWFGTGRFGDGCDKHVGIFYRWNALRLLDRGDFWLSETPDLPGSSSWEIIRPRQVTWGLFETAWCARFHMFNTHFPSRKVEQEARWKTAELILARISALDPALPVIVSADFNSPAGGEIHELLTRYLRDAWLETQRRIGPEGTLNGFGKLSGDRRIDWILFRAPWLVRHVETVALSRNGVYPSDHYPVVAEFEI